MPSRTNSERQDFIRLRMKRNGRPGGRSAAEARRYYGGLYQRLPAVERRKEVIEWRARQGLPVPAVEIPVLAVVGNLATRAVEGQQLDEDQGATVPEVERESSDAPADTASHENEHVATSPTSPCQGSPLQLVESPVAAEATDATTNAVVDRLLAQSEGASIPGGGQQGGTAPASSAMDGDQHTATQPTSPLQDLFVQSAESPVAPAFADVSTEAGEDRILSESPSESQDASLSEVEKQVDVARTLTEIDDDELLPFLAMPSDDDDDQSTTEPTSPCDSDGASDSETELGQCGQYILPGSPDQADLPNSPGSGQFAASGEVSNSDQPDTKPAPQHIPAVVLTDALGSHTEIAPSSQIKEQTQTPEERRRRDSYERILRNEGLWDALVDEKPNTSGALKPAPQERPQKRPQLKKRPQGVPQQGSSAGLSTPDVERSGVAGGSFLSNLLQEMGSKRG